MNTAHNLQSYFGKIEDAVVNVDLLKIGQIYGQNADEGSTTTSTSKSNNKKQNGKYRIALDMEHCLDRFYGGYYSDWACGGQWNRALQFVQLLANAFNSAQIELIVFFDGTLRNKKILQSEQSDVRHKILSVLKHIRVIGTPPPKIWWLPPSGTKTFLRNALRSINIQVMQTVHDHTGEIIDYFHEYKLNGIMGLNSDYLYSNASHYYSSHDLRLSYKGSLETKEFIIQTFLKQNDLTFEHLTYLAIFLNPKVHLVDDDLLKEFYEKNFIIDYNLDYEVKLKKFVEIFKKNPFSDIDEFIKIHNLCDNSKIIKDSYIYYQTKLKGKKNVLNNIIKNQKNEKNRNAAAAVAAAAAVVATSSASVSTAPDAVVLPATTVSQTVATATIPTVTTTVPVSVVSAGGGSVTMENDIENKKDELNEKEEKSVTPPPVVVSPVVVAVEADNLKTKNDKNKVNNKTQQHQQSYDDKPSFIYTLPGEVIKTALNRHQRGIMDSRIYHLLTKKEIILPQILEDEQYREVPSINQFYRPARQMIYATLFNLYHQNFLCSKNNINMKNNHKNHKNGNNKNHFQPEVKISEWIWRPQNEYKTPEMVNAVSLPWAVPTVQRLWFGTSLEDKQRRMKAFLTIMRSDSPLMLNRGYVPQHMLVMACVLRYIITSPERNILTRPELDAFLATAFSLQLNNVEYTQELTLPGVNTRGVFLASLFTQGIETASLANDACGVPLPWIMTNPWLFFDGKLFHLKLKMSTYVQNLRQLCEDQIEIVMKIERFRKAILEGLEHSLMPNQDILYRQATFVHPNIAQQFSKSYAIQNIPSGNYYTNASQTNYYQPTNLHLARDTTFLNRGGKILNNRGLSRLSNTGLSGLHQRGYQLKVGGIVVGSWADGVTNKSINHKKIMNLTRNSRYTNQRGRTTVNNRMSRITMNGYHPTNVTRTIGRHAPSNRHNRNRKNKKKQQQQQIKKEISVDNNKTKETENELSNADKDKPVKRDSTVELSNGTNVVAPESENAIVSSPSDDEVSDKTKAAASSSIIPNNIARNDNPKEDDDDTSCSLPNNNIINDENNIDGSASTIAITTNSTSSSPTNEPNKKSKNITWQQPLTKSNETAVVVEESG